MITGVTLPLALTDDTSQRDIVAGLEELAEAEPEYRKAKDYFDGTTPEFFASARIRRKLAAQGSRFRVNLAKKAVTNVLNRMEIAAVTVPDNAQATKRLQTEVWDRNELGLEMPVILERACSMGDEYVFLAEGDDGGVEIERSGALSTRIIYDPERPRHPKYGIKTWEVGPKADTSKRRTRVNLYYPEDRDTGEPARIERWITRDGMKGVKPEEWEPYQIETVGDGESEIVVPWTEDLDRFPIYHFRTSRPYGHALHRDAYGAQDALNKLIVTHMSTIDHAGFPIRYALAEGGSSEGDDDSDDFGTLDDPLETGITDEDGRRTDETSKLKSGPGEFWWLAGAKGAGQFDPADPKTFLEPEEFFIRLMAQATDMPLHFFDPGGDQPSGDSRRTAEGTLTKKVDYLELSFETTLSRLLTDALAILGIKVSRVDVRWTPSQTTDDLEGWQTAKAKIDAGVPVAQALMEAGYDRDTVTEWMSNSDEQDLRRRISLLGDLAKAMRDLGTGVGMGVVPAELVQSVLAGFIPAADDQPQA
jgi:hypothetical protein